MWGFPEEVDEKMATRLYQTSPLGRPIADFVNLDFSLQGSFLPFLVHLRFIEHCVYIILQYGVLIQCVITLSPILRNGYRTACTVVVRSLRVSACDSTYSDRLSSDSKNRAISCEYGGSGRIPSYFAVSIDHVFLSSPCRRYEGATQIHCSTQDAGILDRSRHRTAQPPSARPSLSVKINPGPGSPCLSHITKSQPISFFSAVAIRNNRRCIHAGDLASTGT